MAQIEFTGAICPQSAFLSHSSELDTRRSPGIPAGLKDIVGDQPASPANTFAYTLDLTRCATSPIYGDGSPAPPYSFAPGDTRALTLQYTTPNPEGSVGGGQMLWFKRVS
jgi:hypothetical protein